MIIWAVDPGPVVSALVLLDAATDRVPWLGIEASATIRDRIRRRPTGHGEVLVIERIANMGQVVGAAVFDTCMWSGRFIEAWGDDASVYRLTRVEVKRALCPGRRAKDPEVRAALIARYGGQATAIGTRLARGPLWGVTSHAWAALAVGMVWRDGQRVGRKDGWLYGEDEGAKAEDGDGRGGDRGGTDRGGTAASDERRTVGAASRERGASGIGPDAGGTGDGRRSDAARGGGPWPDGHR